ncbi:lysophospholipid acyltransferase family protein [Tabrizicola sp. L79]|uniref:lysophospholipid acyltransferase family protein n=1 Tax=Pseudotabrizicola sp. L79 TaxID=3118402 RepID=UPI002F95D2E7
MRHDVTQDISYASSASGPIGAALIRVLENTTGRLSLIRRAAGYEQDVARGRSFWDVLPERFGLNLEVIGGRLENIPANGPLIVISNHPYGILDGLMMGHVLDKVRGDFRILANSVFRRAEALNRVVLPISFDDTKEAVKQNLATRAAALDYLGQGGAIGVFPGGTVSTSAKPFSQPMDPGWRNFTAKMVAKSDATVVPIFFAGHNSRLFQLASHVHSNLRLGLLIKEFRARVDEPVKVVIGEPLAAAQLQALKADPARMMEYLRRVTYDLSPAPQRSYDLGYEFEARYKTR